MKEAPTRKQQINKAVDQAQRSHTLINLLHGLIDQFEALSVAGGGDETIYRLTSQSTRRLKVESQRQLRLMDAAEADIHRIAGLGGAS